MTNFSFSTDSNELTLTITILTVPVSDTFFNGTIMAPVMYLQSRWSATSPCALLPYHKPDQIKILVAAYGPHHTRSLQHQKQTNLQLQRVVCRIAVTLIPQDQPMTRQNPKQQKHKSRALKGFWLIQSATDCRLSRPYRSKLIVLFCSVHMCV